jgi:5'-3' exonuclease
MGRRLALIDGDVLVYRAGFASDARAKERGEEREPLEFALNAVNTTLHGILQGAQAKDYLVYLSHPVNYREELFPEYKANRDVTHKPKWYDEIKHFILERHNALYSAQGDEADDALGIHQMAAMWSDEETIICSIDKDLDMIPGLHYNFSKNRVANGVYEIEDPEGLRLFYRQMVTGDSTDNIPGIYKQKGVKAQERLMAPIDAMTSNRDMYDYVLQLYGEEHREFLRINGKLLWIKRDDTWWEPPL